MFSVHEFIGLKCSLESCPGLYPRMLFNDTWQIHCFQNSVWDTDCGIPARELMSCCIGSIMEILRRGGGGGYPQISRNQLTPAASPNSEESKHIYKIKWAVITEGEMPCSLTALGELPVSIIQTSSSFFRPWIREEWSWAPLRVQSSLHSTLSAPSLSANIFGDKIRESWLCTV